MDDRKPEICFRDDDIKKYAGKAVTGFQVGDELELTLKCRVKGVESSEHPDYGEQPVAIGEKSKPRKNVLEKRLELEVVGGGDNGDQVDDYLKKGIGEE
jgi:hypothetical protein